MTEYKIFFTPKALQDLTSIHDWGKRFWGKSKADAWLKDIGKRIKTLSQMPERNPLAPENDDEPETIRQMLVNRYRIIYTVEKQTVTLLHMRGAYVTSQDITADDEE